MNQDFFKLSKLGSVRHYSISRINYNINRVKGLLPNLPPSLVEHLSSQSIVSYQSLPYLRATLKANTSLLKGQMGTYIITNQKDNKEYVGQSIDLRRRLLQ